MKTWNRITPLSPATQIIWWVTRALLLIWGIIGIFYGYSVQFVQAVFAILFTHLWDMWQMWGGKSFITRIPAYLQTELNIFICFGCVIGTSVNNFTDFQYIDLPEHLFAGFLSATFGFILSDMMQGEKKKIKPAVQGLFALGFGIAMMVGWEFYEFTMDRLYGFNMQHAQIPTKDGLVDTMIDLILGSIGALGAMFFESFRRTGRFGPDKEKKREIYLNSKKEAKEEKEKLYQDKMRRFKSYKR